MTDTFEHTALQTIVAITVSIFGGGAATRGWDRWRRNGRGNGDADRIVKAIEKSGTQVSGEIQGLRKETHDLHLRIENVIGRLEAGP